MSGWFGLPKTYHRYDSRHGLWEWSSTSTGRITDGGLHSRKGGTGVPFLWAALERLGCYPTWEGLAWGCCAGGS